MSSLPRGYESFDLLNQQQKQLFSILQNAAMGQLTPQNDERFSAPYLRQFQEQIIPQLAERFSGAGAGAQSSSAFQQALGQSGADLTERLAFMNANRSDQQRQSGLSLLMQLLGMPQTGLVQKAPGLGSILGKAGAGALGGAGTGALLGSAVPGLGTGLGALFGGLAGLGKGLL